MSSVRKSAARLLPSRIEAGTPSPFRPSKEGNLEKRYLVWLIAALVIGVAIFVLRPFFISESAHSGPAGLVGQAAPVFALRDDRGSPVSLTQYRGRVVIMNLWASWCPPCRAEMPDLQRLEEANAQRGLVVVGVNEGESAQRARTFAASLRIRFPIWIDDGQRYGRIYAALGLPTTVIVDPDGVIVKGFDGPLTFEQMRAAVAGLVPQR
jgi:thiol-disulfide isomerase/thioredoxin